MDRRKLVTLLVVLFTVVLAGVAIFTAVRLYQQREGSVAPTAPTSIPRAVTPATTSCNPVEFTLATAPICGDTCSPNDPNSCPEDHTCSDTTNTCVIDECLVEGATCDTDQCNEINVADPNCGDTCDPSDTNSCPLDHTCDAGTNTCVLNACQESGKTCTADNCSLAPECGDTCSSNAECPNDHSCSGGSCVLNDCLTSGATCTADNCSTTTPPVSTSAPTAPPKLPDAGTELPTLVMGVIGLFTIVGALFFVF